MMGHDYSTNVYFFPDEPKSEIFQAEDLQLCDFMVFLKS